MEPTNKPARLPFEIERARDGGYALFDREGQLIHAAETLHALVSHVLVVGKAHFEPPAPAPVLEPEAMARRFAPPQGQLPGMLPTPGAPYTPGAVERLAGAVRRVAGG